MWDDVVPRGHSNGAILVAVCVVCALLMLIRALYDGLRK